MRLFRFISLSSKDTFSQIYLSTLVALSFCVSACEDETDSSSSSVSISFTSEINASWTPLTRSTSSTDIPSGIVTTLQGEGGTTLYLHTTYTDSISLLPSLSRSDTSMLTRAMPVTTSTMYDSFGVSAYSYTDSWSESKIPNYMYDATASKSGSDYHLSSTYYWPGASYKMKFFAYAPQGNSQYVLSGSTQAGSPTIRVTVPSNVGKQEDLLVAQSAELSGNNNSAVNLTFYHTLTAVRFVCGDDMQAGTVKSVSLKNVYSKGIYDMRTRSWSSTEFPTVFSQVLDKSTTGEADEAITTETQTFMMVPQTLPDGAGIEVAFIDSSGTVHTLTADIKGTQWAMGKTVTYMISSSSINWTYTLAVTKSTDFTYTGGTRLYDVTSYRINTKGVQEPVAWTTQYSTDNGTNWIDSKPEWLTTFTASGAGGTSAQPYEVTVNAQTGTENNSHTDALKVTAVKGTETMPYNLSGSNGNATVENTANCYVINAPGVYSIPLVYGNAIKNSATNAAAYISAASGINILRHFINHAGTRISKPYISDNGCTPAKAILVWQDALNLVTDIKYNSGTNGGNISFKVDKENIRQGNAVIAIKDASNTVLWSWHIWVTDEDINNTIEVTNHQHVKYRFMSINLGWCDGYTINYPERSCKVKFTAGPLVKEMIIMQAANTITIGDSHPYYQWGRKDPFLPSNGLSNTNKTWYDKDGIPSTASPAQENLSTGVTCIKNYILKPDVMQKHDNGDNLYYNLWSANNTQITANDDPVVKTIYDPCPAGFKLPAGNTFSGFTTTGQSTSTVSEINGTWDSSKKGWNFYSGPNKTGTQIFFKVSGWRRGEMSDVGSYGYCWSAIPNGQSNGHYLIFGSSGVGPLSNTYRTYGFGVHPSQE